MTEIQFFVLDTLIDLISSSPGCSCCDNNVEHAELIKRALARAPISLWPLPALVTARPALASLYYQQPYQVILKALEDRRVLW